ncbi:hypothetical protein G9A89_012926 [Geosiphon pyriformis]|nr:hypothetical protein G9A89_012926 [Geosiphon pyriformis]
MKQDTTQTTLFELVYGRTAILLVEIELPEKPVEFKIEDKVLLHHTKVEKQWNGKFDPKWDRPFHIEEILRNGAYKLRLNNKILTKTAYTSSSTSNISQLKQKIEITDSIHLLAQQFFQLIQQQEMEITINQQTIKYTNTKKKP